MHWISLIRAHCWRQFYTAGKYFALLATILHCWQIFCATGNNFTLLAAILHYQLRAVVPVVINIMRVFKDWNELSQNQQKKLCKLPCVSYLQSHKCNVNEIPNFFPLVQCINTPPFTLINISLDSVVFGICALHLFCALFKFKLYFTTFILCRNPVLSIEICSFCNIWIQIGVCPSKDQYFD